MCWCVREWQGATQSAVCAGPAGRGGRNKPTCQRAIVMKRRTPPCNLWHFCKCGRFFFSLRTPCTHKQQWILTQRVSTAERGCFFCPYIKIIKICRLMKPEWIARGLLKNGTKCEFFPVFAGWLLRCYEIHTLRRHTPHTTKAAAFLSLSCLLPFHSAGGRPRRSCLVINNSRKEELMTPAGRKIQPAH